MQSNREDFLYMREQGVQESPEIEREEERKPEALPYRLDLERRLKAYLNAVERNKIKKFGLDHVIRERNRNHTDMSDWDQRPLHNHAKPLTAFQKLHFTPKNKPIEYELPTTEDIKESFKAFKKSRDLGSV
jgi:hypothetical protein